MAGKATKASSEQAQLVPAVAPPPYTEQPACNHPGASSSQHHQQQHQRYPSGPTAFSSLPIPGPALHAQADSQYAYLTARAAASRADRRAARRLCGAFCWAIVLWMIMGAVVGGVVGNEVSRRSQQEEHRHHRRPQSWQILRAQSNRVALAARPDALAVPVEEGFASI